MPGEVQITPQQEQGKIRFGHPSGEIEWKSELFLSWVLVEKLDISREFALPQDKINVDENL